MDRKEELRQWFDLAKQNLDVAKYMTEPEYETYFNVSQSPRTAQCILQAKKKRRRTAQR
jgi:hypothetical protein